MTNNTNLKFIRNKISELQHAIMHVDKTGSLKFQNDIVSAIQVDQEGYLWLLANYHLFHTEDSEQAFPVNLVFYKKGVHFFIEINGTAVIISNDLLYEHQPNNPDALHSSKKVLLKLSVQNIEYTEFDNIKPKRKIQSFIEGIYSWFINIVSVQHGTHPVLKRFRPSS